jgi:hypothetical protein
MQTPRSKLISLVLIILGALLAACVYDFRGIRQQSTRPSAAPPQQTAGQFWAYTNATYHFSLQLPKYVYWPVCQGDWWNASAFKKPTPIRVVEGTSTILIGVYIQACDKPGTTTFEGWQIYASNNIISQHDGNDFVQKVLGPGCELVTSPGNDEGFWIVNAPRRNCSVGRPAIWFSPRLGTLVFWSTNDALDFPSPTGWYDDQIESSFSFASST